jgi:hypothetical protein
MDLTGKSEIEKALRGVGEILASEGLAYAIVVVGGAALNLLGIVERTTTDAARALIELYEMVDELGITPPEPLPLADLKGLSLSHGPNARGDEGRS